MQKKISFLIPTLNRCEKVVEAIDSALRFPYENKEVIVSDNGSCDGTHLFLKNKYGESIVLFSHEKTIPMSLHWRFLLNKSSGDFFLLISDDDSIIASDEMAVEVSRKINDGSELGALFMGTRFRTYSEKNVHIEDAKFNNGLPFKFLERKELFLNYGNVELLPLSRITIGSSFFLTKMAKDLNAFSEENNIGCDTSLFLDAIRSSSVAWIGDVFSIYNTHDDNLMGKYKKNYDLLSSTAFCILKPVERALIDGLVTCKEVRSSNVFSNGVDLVVDFMDVSCRDFSSLSRVSGRKILTQLPWSVYGISAFRLWIHALLVFISPWIYFHLRSLYREYREYRE